MSAAPPSGPPPTPAPVAPAPVQPGLTRGQRLALWIAGGAALLAVLATTLVAILPPAGPAAAPKPTTPTQAQLTYHATQTAEAFQLIQPYAPQGIGPCDMADPPFGQDNHNYWQWDANPGALACAPGGVTRMISDGAYLAFYGFPNGFPKAFTATLTLVFNADYPPPDGSGCLTYSLTYEGGVQGLILCDNGMWQSTQYNGASGYTPPAPGAPFVLTMQVSPTGVAFVVNNQQATPPAARGPITDITLKATLGAPGTVPSSSIAIFSFVLTPLT